MPERKLIIPGEDEEDIVSGSVMSALLFGVIFMVVIPMLPIVQSAQRYFTSHSYQGDVETKVLNATGILQWLDFTNICPYLISAFFINRGPSTVYIGINEYDDWLEMRPGETRTVSHVGADKRIVIIYYKCDPGQTATVEVEGHF